jgi:hypothetical protein
MLQKYQERRAPELPGESVLLKYQESVGAPEVAQRARA